MACKESGLGFPRNQDCDQSRRPRRLAGRVDQRRTTAPHDRSRNSLAVLLRYDRLVVTITCRDASGATGLIDENGLLHPMLFEKSELRESSGPHSSAQCDRGLVGSLIASSRAARPRASITTPSKNDEAILPPLANETRPTPISRPLPSRAAGSERRGRREPPSYHSDRAAPIATGRTCGRTLPHESSFRPGSMAVAVRAATTCAREPAGGWQASCAASDS